MQILYFYNNNLLILVSQKTMIMKNFYLAVGSILLASSGFAQQLKSLPSTMNAKAASMNVKTTKPFAAKLDGEVIYTNTFNNTADWNKVDNSVPLTIGGGWKVGTAAPAGPFLREWERSLLQLPQMVSVCLIQTTSTLPKVSKMLLWSLLQESTSQRSQT